MNTNLFTVIAALIPLIVILIVFFFRIEGRLTRIETDLSWIKKGLPKCQPNLEEIIP